MSDDFDIDKFLNDSFAKIEKKIEKKGTKKVEKIISKAISNSVISNSNVPSNVKNEKINFQINDYNFDNVISNRIYEESSIPIPGGTNIKLDNLLKPLFPNDAVYEKEFRNQDKNFILDRFIGNPKKEEEVPKTNLPMSLKINKFKKIKESNLIKLLKKDDTIKYSELIKMHTLWNDYISILLNKTTQVDTINSKMLKADLHGAIIQVISSKNSNQIGLKGLNLLETRRSFNLLCEDDRIRTILKRGSVFSLDLPYADKRYSIHILGDNFTYKAVERTKAKYKIKYNL